MRAFVSTRPGAASCPTGGITLSVGVDQNGNGVFDIPSEVTDTEVICNGGGSVCSDGVITPPEECDGAALGRGAGLGLTCNATCSGFVASGDPPSACATCTANRCLDLVLDCGDESLRLPPSPPGSCLTTLNCVSSSWPSFSQPNCAQNDNGVVCYCGINDGVVNFNGCLGVFSPTTYPPVCAWPDSSTQGSAPLFASVPGAPGWVPRPSPARSGSVSV